MSAARQLPLLADARSLEGRWLAFHEANPHVYAAFERLALQAAKRRARFGAKAIWEVLRWELSVNTTESEPRLNNNYTALYAREVMRRNPDLVGLFETRERKA